MQKQQKKHPKGYRTKVKGYSEEGDFYLYNTHTDEQEVLEAFSDRFSESNFGLSEENTKFF